MRFVLFGLTLVAFARGAGAQAPADAPPPPSEAYYEFLLGRHLEGQGDLDAARAALERAARLDPTSAEIPADLAGLFARLNRPAEAMKAAEQAVAVDPNNVTGNRILGSIYLSLTQSPQATPADVRRNAERAIRYLERANPDESARVRLSLGQMYVQVQEWSKAVDILSRVIEDDAGSREAREAVALLVEAYQGSGRGAEAMRLLEENAGSSPRLQMMLGELYEAQRRWADAATAFGRAVERRPRDIELKVRWATVLLNVGETPAVEQARTALKEVVAAEPSNGQALYLLVQAERSLFNPAGAEATARQMIQADPDGVWGQYALALVLDDRRDYPGVIAALEPLASGWTERSDGGQRLGGARLFQQLGIAYQGVGQYEKAIERFEQARRFAPGDVRLALLQATAHRLNGQLPRGVGVLEDVLARASDQPMAYQALAELYVEAGQVPQALETVDRAAARLPDNTSVAFGVGAALERQRHYAEAEQAFRQVLSRDPDHSQALNYLGYMLADRGERLEESVGYITRALELDPGNPAIVDSLGWAYFKLNQLEVAERYLRQAAAQLVTNSVIQDHLGDTLIRLGHLDEAVSAWQRALEGDGDSIERSVIEKKIGMAQDRIRGK